MVLFSRSCNVFSVFCYVLFIEFLRKYYIQLGSYDRTKCSGSFLFFNFGIFEYLKHFIVSFIFYNELAIRCLYMISKNTFRI